MAFAPVNTSAYTPSDPAPYSSPHPATHTSSDTQSLATSLGRQHPIKLAAVSVVYEFSAIQIDF